MNPINMMLEGATWTPITDQPAMSGALHATHSGVLTIEGLTVKCWQLSDGRRVIDGQSMAQLFGFGSPEELAADIERLGGGDVAAKLRAPVEFTT